MQQFHGIGVSPALVCIREVSAEIAERSRAEQRIADRMREDVCIGMPERTTLERNFNAADNEFASLYETMRIESMSYSHKLSS
jgi:hypothetical protein